MTRQLPLFEALPPRMTGPAPTFRGPSAMGSRKTRSLRMPAIPPPETVHVFLAPEVAEWKVFASRDAAEGWARTYGGRVESYRR